MPDTIFLTTAIDYTNGAPHIGHAYEKVLADVIARFHRLRGDRVYFLTGVDQHGQKVQQSAEREGVAPQAFADRITALFRTLWVKLGVEYDGWAATTDPLHKRCVQRILQRLNDEGQLYKKAEGGYYSIRQEQFLTDKERGENGEFGPEWGEVEFREEENYYFRLAPHRDWLLALIDARPEIVSPAFRRAELRNAAEKLTGDLCISRPQARLSWGIEFPFDPNFVTFVWFDALINYISFAGYEAEPGSGLPEFARLWPATAHIIGKDIMIPAHGVYWPIMLHALGFADTEISPLLVHGFWNMGGAKMSKSLGNSADPAALAEKYGAETLRHYLMSDIATGRDADFSEERLVMRSNEDLAKNLGNLLNRTLSMAAKYRSGRLAKFQHPGDVRLEAVVDNYVAIYRDRFEGFSTALDGTREKSDPYQIHSALGAVFDLASHCNQFIQNEQPWVLNADPEQATRLDAVLYHLADSLRILAILLSPVLPEAARGIAAQLNWDRPFALADAKWGGLPDGHQLGVGTPLFPKLEAPPAAE
ncbi:MAG TPA: methionine--tRNA ligase [Chthoniobacteraceae bacterium]|jgi:methionyl-tRNA synthetase|nr:methionine--tRNA ligase [Chthoniobacteraceae bacterium]